MDSLSTEIIDRISKLSYSRERYILEMRLGINADRPHTLQEIADKLELSRERVRQIQHGALLELASPELNSLLLVAEIASPSRMQKRTKAKKNLKHSNAKLRTKTKAAQTDQFIIVNFHSPTNGKDPIDGSKFIADRHKVKADWVRQDGQETLFITDGEVVSSWPTKIIAGITWPTGIDIPTTPREFADRMNEIKAIYPKAWSKWSYEEELKLSMLFTSGQRVGEIATALGRAPGGIFSRLRKINLINEDIEFSEELVYSTTEFEEIQTGNVYELIHNLYQVSISSAVSDKVNSKFNEQGWFVLTDELFKCTECNKFRILVMRKHWKNMGRVFHRWAIACIQCNKVGESRDFDDETINEIHKKLEGGPQVEELCPDCVN